MKRLLRGLTAGAMLSLCAGCVLLGDKADQFRWHFVTLPFFVFDNAPVYHQPKQTAVMENSTNVAIAISGGGTRSAVFAAGVFEQLAHMPGIHGKRSLLESCDVISGVSGGSLAAAYYGLYKPKSFSNPEETDQFFRHFQSQMTCDFVSKSAIHYLSHPWEAVSQYYTRHRLVQTMANTFDQYLFHGATFDDIGCKEHCEDSPALLLNAVSLDTGKRFIFTNLNVARNFSVDPAALAQNLPSVAPPSDVAALGLLGKIVSSDVCAPFGFDCIDSDIGMFRLASAIAASSAYPVLPGPAALIDYSHNGYVHLGDGGVNDNTGMDSIVELYLHKLEHASAPKKLVILSINVSGPVMPKKLGDPNGWVSSIAYGERASNILAQRGQTFAQTLMQAPQSSIKIVSLNIQESPNADRLTSPLSTLCISEEDYGYVIAAAADVAEQHRKEITAALAGE